MAIWGGLHVLTTANFCVVLVQFAVLAMLIMFSRVGMGAAQAPGAKHLCPGSNGGAATAAHPVEGNRFHHQKNRLQRHSRAGGVLIGFDIQLSKFSNYETVNALRPIYATEAGVITSEEFGVFGSKTDGKQNTNLTRAVRVLAPEGFAVGGITVRRGLFIDGMKMTFHRIKGYALDMNDAAVTDWIGNNKGGHTERTIGDNGAPIVGIFGHKDDRRVLALGVYQLAAAVVTLPRPVPKEAEPEPEKVADTPLRRSRSLSATSRNRRPRKRRISRHGCCLGSLAAWASSWSSAAGWSLPARRVCRRSKSGIAARSKRRRFARRRAADSSA